MAQRDKSWGGKVRVVNVSLAAEGPFHYLPDGRPVITGIKSQYLVMDWVDLTCTSRRSRPPPTLTFTINKQPVNQHDHDGLSTSSLRLRFSLLPRLLQEGDAVVLCISKIPGIYEQMVQEVLTTNPPYHASVLGGGAAPGQATTVASTATLVISLLLTLCVFLSPHI
ncbi:putative immunoglobulin-like 7 [Homarus americanus]|uniref:Putative immunoglobulin-like 7 n=1 Tax=Homarus americanus TaxID=6706 RepID=A0A8J5MYI7_HOMAM|nr:putative immunoglobulin-like 7 [Homarus americanus]